MYKILLLKIQKNSVGYFKEHEKPQHHYLQPTKTCSNLPNLPSNH